MCQEFNGLNSPTSGGLDTARGESQGDVHLRVTDAVELLQRSGAAAGKHGDWQVHAGTWQALA